MTIDNFFISQIYYFYGNFTTFGQLLITKSSKKMKKLALYLMLILVSASLTAAPPRQSFVKVTVTPDHADWCYNCGEKPVFHVSVTDCSNAPIKDAQIYYEISEDFLEPLEKGDKTLK